MGLAGPAAAADLRTKAPVVSAPAWSWSGGYAGIHGGYGWGSADQTFHPANTVFAPSGSGFDQDIDGGLFGLQIGYNWQIGNLVFGLETTTAWTSIEGKDASLFGAFPDAAYKTEIDNLSTFTPRLGIASGPWLLYGKAGIAYGEVKTTLSDGSLYFREKNDHVGWTAGVGLEYALAPNWILGVEYNYVDLGDQRYGGAVATGIAADLKQDVTVSTVLGRLSYKFGAGGNPLTAALLGPQTPGGNWNGFYLGVLGGYAWGETDLADAGSADHDIDGGVFGGHLGFLTQFGNNWVLGTELAISGGDVKGNFSDGFTTLESKLTWFGTVTARLGYAIGPWLVYGKGGTAFGEVKQSLFDPVASFQQSEQHIGWTIGGGVEYAWGNWLVGVEYNYIDLGDQTYGGFATPDIYYTSFKNDITVSTVLARLSYKFGAPEPVVAKY
ncbi:structural elements [Blastochloris viridis]|uniref:Structural elements n=1 Tax=Blastochloris viridis TaxID=1079 RepID=A0A182CXL2_BLAVI|nr:structural elements [Blastochloris viridis]